MGGKTVVQQPNMTESTKEAYNAELQLLPLRYQTELQYRPKFDELDAAQAARTASALAKAQYDNELEYGPKFLDQALANLERADPEGQAARRLMAEMVTNDAKLGGALSDSELRDVEQGVRKAQAARGNVGGPANAYSEVLAKNTASNARKQQRLANLGSFLAGTSPQAQFGQVSQAQQGAAPFNPVVNSAVDMAGVRSGAQSIYGAQAQAQQAALSRPNPWAQALGAGVGILGAAMI